MDFAIPLPVLHSRLILQCCLRECHRTICQYVSCRKKAVVELVHHYKWCSSVHKGPLSSRTGDNMQDAAKSVSSSEEVSDDEYIPVLSAGASLASRSSAEVAHFGAAKERKLSLENGIAVFNRFVSKSTFIVCIPVLPPYDRCRVIG